MVSSWIHNLRCPTSSLLYIGPQQHGNCCTPRSMYDTNSPRISFRRGKIGNRWATRVANKKKYNRQRTTMEFSYKVARICKIWAIQQSCSTNSHCFGVEWIDDDVITGVDLLQLTHWSWGDVWEEVRNSDIFAHFHAQMSYPVTITHRTTTWKLLHSMEDVTQHTSPWKLNPKGKLTNRWGTRGWQRKAS